MKPLHLPLSSVFLCVAAVTGNADTFIVDDNGGPGVDFTDLPPAIAAAANGDLLLVQSGNYSGFVTSKGVTILGAENVCIEDRITFDSVPSTQEVRVSHITLEELRILSCDGAVIIEELDMNTPFDDGWVDVQDSADVRLRGVTGDFGWVRVRSSRAELVHCSITGNPGFDGNFVTPGGPGIPALQVEAGSEVHVARSTLIGGRGGDTMSQLGDFGGDGAPGIEIDPGCEVFVSGLPQDVIQGGDGGEGPSFGDDGFGGDGILNDGVLRVSGVTLLGGSSFDFIDGEPLAGSGKVDMPAVPDPVLSFETPGGIATAGQNVTITVHGEVGVNVRVALGRTPIVVSTPGIFGDLLTDPVRLVPAGQIGGDGTLVYILNVPGNIPPGFLVIAQAFLTETDGTTTRTHSVPFLIH